MKFLSKVAPVSTDSFVASGASHAPGFVPDPPATSGTTKFLREDASWAVPTASATPAGSSGQVQYTSGSSPLAADSAFVWDATNHRLGIGAASPSTPLEVATASAATDVVTIRQSTT